MNNIEKKLDALIDALGFDVEETDNSIKMYKIEDIDNNGDPYIDANPDVIKVIDYKLTKKKYNHKPTLHEVVRQYENGAITNTEMVASIMLMESLSNEDL